MPQQSPTLPSLAPAAEQRSAQSLGFSVELEDVVVSGSGSEFVLIVAVKVVDFELLVTSDVVDSG